MLVLNNHQAYTMHTQITGLFFVIKCCKLTFLNIWIWIRREPKIVNWYFQFWIFLSNSFLLEKYNFPKRSTSDLEFENINILT